MIVANTTICAAARLRERDKANERADCPAGRCFDCRRGWWRRTIVRAEGAFPLIGVGGIDSGGAALTKIRAGASLIQLYSSLVYRGLGLVDEIKNDLASTCCDRDATRCRKSSARMRRRSRAEDWPVDITRAMSIGRLSATASALRHANDFAHKRRISRRLQAAARDVMHDSIAPHNPALPNDRSANHAVKKISKRGHHQVAHVARPGRADINAVEGKGEHAAAAAPASRTADNHARMRRTSALAVMMSISAGAEQQRSRRRRGAKPKPQSDDELHRAGEGRAVARAIGPAAELLGGVGEPVEEKGADQRENCCSTALAASVMSPARAPCAVKNRNAAISAAVRIMMSRLIASMRISLARSNSNARGRRELPVRERGTRSAGRERGLRLRRSRAAIAAPAMPKSNTSTSTTVAAMLMRLIDDLHRRAPALARACPISQPSMT